MYYPMEKTIIKNEIIELHPNEVNLIKRMRQQYRFGEILVVVQDGIPQRIRRAVISDNLKDELSDEK